MKKQISIILLIILSMHGYVASSQTFTLNRQILSSTDDAEEKFDGSYITTSSSDIEMMYDSWNSQGLQKIGLRFDEITIPSNANILNAYIQFTAKGESSGTLDIIIKGEDISNSPTFSSSNNVSSRTTTTSSVLWNSIPSWVDNDAGINQRTPDLTTIVSEIITSNGWQAGNPVTFIVTGTGGSSQLRRAYSFDGSSVNSAELVVEYASNSDVDLELRSCITPGNINYPNPASIVQVEITNYGNLSASNYNVSYSIDGSLIATEPGTVDLTLGQSTIFTFSQTADLSALGSYNLSTKVTILNDENLANDSIIKTISVINEDETFFFSQGSSWRYLDSGIDPGSTWHTTGFDDASWLIGVGHMGFGDSDEQTTLNNGIASYYFRKNVNIDDVNLLDNIYLHLVHDDAAIVYVNGQEVMRSEMMPLGAISHTTSARQSINSSIENDPFTYKINPSFFITGQNTIAISLRNESASDGDLSFDCHITPIFSYDKDGPYVYYNGSDVIVEEITSAGLVSNTYASTSGLQLTCSLPHMGTSFSFTLKPQITIEPSFYSPTPPKFLTISDFDGHIEGLTMILKAEGIIDDNFNWIYGDGHLIISGDIFDRGFHITESLWLVYKLESEAEAQGGKVHLIIGNHEMFNMSDDWRYVETKYFNNAHLMGKRMSELYDSNTEIGRWLRSKNIMEKLGDYAVLHGGLSPEVAALNLSIDQINDYGRIEMNGMSCPNNDCYVVNGSDGIYWYRGMVDQELTQQQVDDMLDGFGVERVIVGHTKGNTIRSLYNDRVMAVDMYHIDNFEDGYMEALQFELGCFYVFHTDGVDHTYTQIGSCDSYNTGNMLDINGVNQLQIYPNPTSNFLNVKLPADMLGDYSYTVINQEGRQMDQGTINSELSKIDVIHYTSGKYYLTLRNSTRTITGSFIFRN